MDLDPVVDELYAGPPETFVATRTAREKQAKQAGDGDVAAQIHGLTKPTVAAWLANRLSRERREDIQALVGIGAALRQATASLSGDDFRELTRRQQLLIRDLMRQAKQLAAAAGKIIGETTAREVEDTLRAAVVDEGAGQELIQGRLTTGLRRTGFDSAGTTPAANRRPPRSVPRSDEQRREEAIARADRDVIEATDAERTAVAERDRAHQTLAETDRRAADALAEVDRLRAELRAAAELQSDLERDQLRARRALDRADGSARAAGRRLAEVSKRREELADPAPNRAD